jgi:hypothetical protein
LKVHLNPFCYYCEVDVFDDDVNNANISFCLSPLPKLSAIFVLDVWQIQSQFQPVEQVACLLVDVNALNNKGIVKK